RARHQGRRAGHGSAPGPQPDRSDAPAGDTRPAARNTMRQPGHRLPRRTDRRGAQPGAYAVSAVWPVARAAVRRRRVQTVVIGVVVLLSTTMIVVALG